MPTCIWHRLLLLPLKISLITETESVDSVMLLFRTNEQIRAEIENKFGFIPPFFSPAQRNPQVLENLWQQTLNAYVSNPLPLLFKEKLSAYLSRFCAVPYCMICHSCSLVPLGMKAREVLELLESPLPTEDEIDKHLRLLATKSNGIDIFLEANSLLEESLLYCSIFIAMERDRAQACRNELRRVLGLENYQYLVSFIAYVKTCHVWMEAHPEVSYEMDKRVIDHLKTLLDEEPELTNFFKNYWERVTREQQSWAEKMATIAQRKQAEQKIREQAALLDVAKDAIFVKDLNNQIVFWNKGAQKLFGWKAEDAIGKQASALLPRHNSRHYQDIQKTLLDRGQWQGELREVTKDGTEAIVESRWTLVRDEAEQPKSILVVNTDITEKKQLETQFLRVQRMESIGSLAGGIAHDLNNVLSPILMAVQLLSAKLHDESAQQWLKIIEINAKRGAELVKQVVSFARGMESERTLVQVQHLIKEIKQIASQTFPKSISIHTEIAKDLWAVSGNTTQLHQVVMNLCINARDALPNGGTLSISARNGVLNEQFTPLNLDAKASRYIAIAVSDTGIGISPEHLDRIFEPFFTTKDAGKGTGLGLSTVMGIVKAHGGFVNVSSKLGQGTTFEVYLPASDQTTTTKLEVLELPSGHGELILLVDDEAAIRQISQTILETHAYNVLTASNGIEAIAQYIQHQKDISAVLIDMMMPVMDGTPTIRTLQKINPLVKIIAVSGHPLNQTIAEVADTSVTTFLSKPYTAKELLQALQGIVSTSR